VERQFVHFDVAIVPQQQAIVRPEHAKAVAHMVERRVELFHRRGGIRGRQCACGMPDAGQSQQTVDRAKKSGGKFLAEEHRTLQQNGAVSVLRPDDRRRRQACGTGIAIAGIRQGAQGDAKIDIA